ncbi:TetR/AcrR family transcriptional regulator [Cucumibacter marinus]|uniref:TetR/AcrR family transcriptional regulator n=1 Tax=Cucumibacter marinus TaxID=1121252 RepID=UPI00040AEDA4|nr:TetR/AcrR family transcriptional regulator [Cucumibacter marinus]
MAQPAKPGRKTRGRPARSPAQIADMRAGIADCAMRLFLTEGYAAISMRRLAREAGCTPMTLYQYYDSKFDILSALWAEVLGEVFDALADVAAAEADPRARLVAVGEGYVRYWLTHRERYFLVFMSGGVSQAEVTGFVSGSDTLTRFDLLGDVLGTALGDDVEAEALTLKTQMLACLLNGIAHNLITIGGVPWAAPEALVRQGIAGLLEA